MMENKAYKMTNECRDDSDQSAHLCGRISDEGACVHGYQ